MAEIKSGDWVIPMDQIKIDHFLSRTTIVPPDRYLWKIRRVKGKKQVYLDTWKHELVEVYRIGRMNANDWRHAYVRAEDCYHIPHEQMPWLGEDSL